MAIALDSLWLKNNRNLSYFLRAELKDTNLGKLVIVDAEIFAKILFHLGLIQFLCALWQPLNSKSPHLLRTRVRNFWVCTKE